MQNCCALLFATFVNAQGEIWGFRVRLNEGKRNYNCFSRATFSNSMWFYDEAMIGRKVSNESRGTWYLGTTTEPK